jgi:hypothetical protein
VGSWTDLDNNIPSSGSATITLGTAFNCNYNSQISIHAGTNATIHGNGAVLDAAQKGRFFYVYSGAALALDHLELRNGYAVYGGPGTTHPDLSNADVCHRSCSHAMFLTEELSLTCVSTNCCHHPQCC